MPKKVSVIGAGIVGLATARAFSEKGWEVTVYEQNHVASGASIRNFGMIWPIGQTSGHQYERAMRTKAIWKQICQETGYWIDDVGSLHLARTPLEGQVMQEIADLYAKERPIHWLSPQEVSVISPSSNPIGLLGGLWSKDEAIVESRLIMRDLPAYLTERYKVGFKFNQPITQVGNGFIEVNKSKIQTDLVFLCTGEDFKKLYPALFKEHLVNCKLQMLRLVEQPDSFRIGPALCGGLSLAHYKSFEEAPSLIQLKNELQESFKQHLQLGIHVMVSQNHLGQLTVGDSHEYGEDIEPFDKAIINNLIINYLKKMALFKDWTVTQTWNGVYAKCLSGRTEFIQEIEPGVWVINGFGGAGMTLAWGTIEEWASAI